MVPMAASILVHRYGRRSFWNIATDLALARMGLHRTWLMHARGLTSRLATWPSFAHTARGARAGTISNVWRRTVSRFQINRQRRRIIREDRPYLEARVRRFLTNYQAASDSQKTRYYDVVAGASAGCRPAYLAFNSEDPRVAAMAAESANAVVRRRLAGKDNPDRFAPTAHLDGFIIDAYATVAVAYRHAARIYVNDEQLQSLGTEAFHLLTVATSRTTAKSKHGSPWEHFAKSFACANIE
jgi:hypothetical protein